MAYSVTWLEQGYYAKFSGTLTFEDVAEAEKLFYEDERASYVKFQLYDFLDVDDSITEAEINPSHFAITNKGSNTYIKKIKVASVATGKMGDLCREYNRISESLGSNWSFALFDNLADAQEWVNS